ncbi:MAG TPA: PKD domain-containing protein [Gemmatimonadales bacterium]|jgi:PKD repeat protein
MRATYWRIVPLIAFGALGLAGCSDSNSPGNTAPVAQFTSSCTDLDCTFTDLSSDTDGSVDGYAWTFGDGGTSTSQNPVHSFAAANTYDVTLTVTDNDGDATSKTKQVTVTAPAPGGPTADFDISCNSLDCTFTDASTGNVVSWAWSFTDGFTATTQDVSHTFTASGVATHTATLIVTDNNGLTSTKATEFTVSPAATLQCADAGNPNQFASCTLKLLENKKVTVTLTSRECTAHGNTFEITAPITETLFTDGCYNPAEGTSFDLNGGAVFAANTELQAQVISGSTEQVVAPALHVEGSYPTWTLRFDDGEDATPPEPDFNDLVITVTAHD